MNDLMNGNENYTNETAGEAVAPDYLSEEASDAVEESSVTVAEEASDAVEESIVTSVEEASDAVEEPSYEAEPFDLAQPEEAISYETVQTEEVPPVYAADVADSTQPYGDNSFADSTQPYGDSSFTDSTQPYNDGSFADNIQPAYNNGYPDNAQPTYNNMAANAQGNYNQSNGGYYSPSYPAPNYNMAQPNYSNSPYGAANQSAVGGMTYVDGKDGLCITSLVLGICGFFFNPLYLCTILAIVFGVIGKNAQGPKEGLAKTGLVLGIIGCCVQFLFDTVFTICTLGTGFLTFCC